MHQRCLTSLCVLVTVIAVLSLAPAPVAGQARTTEADTWTAPRTPWGDPDLQGLWDNSTTTPLERPRELAGKEFLTDEEVAELSRERPSGAHLALLDREPRGPDGEKQAQVIDRADRPPTAGDPGTYNEFWFAWGNLLRRTSLIVDPPDGRLPPLTPEGEERFAWQQGTDSWDSRNLAERCITRGAPKRPGGYNNNFLILQNPGYVAILQEMIHEVRFIPLDGRPHVGIPQYLGDSRGRWEGNTLVVETTHFTDKVVFNSINCCPGSGANLHLVERFTRVDAETIDYQYTVDDPATYTEPWTVSIPMRRFPGPMYEYACHEHNYGLENILRGARAQERAAEEAAQSQPR